MNQPLLLPAQHSRSIITDVIIAILTCGLYSLYVEYKQIEAMNDFLKRPAYSFWLWLILTVISCSLYNIYHSFKKSDDLQNLLGKKNAEPVLMAIIQFFGLWIIVHAIQQGQINQLASQQSLLSPSFPGPM